MFDATSSLDLIDDVRPSGSPEVRGENPSDKDLQRADGSGRIVLSGSEKGTRIMEVFQRAPIRIIFPRVSGGVVEEAVLVNTAGGIAGRVQIYASLSRGAIISRQPSAPSWRT